MAERQPVSNFAMGENAPLPPASRAGRFVRGRQIERSAREDDFSPANVALQEVKDREVPFFAEGQGRSRKAGKGCGPAVGGQRA